ncbi:hypothetical protein XELAEV_18025389mg [Xenopus laevis]|uniref:Uncharacterized protein n=1 Tax=Xenopus laevis TaxID=8355 RepID=A0A974CZP9_XENLA|nr:hypothetical protein XELAEV_18025389mg [Xenopus laevis]
MKKSWDGSMHGLAIHANIYCNINKIFFLSAQSRLFHKCTFCSCSKFVYNNEYNGSAAGVYLHVAAQLGELSDRSPERMTFQLLSILYVSPFF